MPKFSGLNSPANRGLKNPCGKDGNAKLVQHRKTNLARAGIKEGRNPLK